MHRQKLAELAVGVVLAPMFKRSDVFIRIFKTSCFLITNFNGLKSLEPKNSCICLNFVKQILHSWAWAWLSGPFPYTYRDPCVDDPRGDMDRLPRGFDED